MITAPLHRMSLSELYRRVDGGEVTSVEIVDALAARIASCEPRLHAFTLTMLDDARRDAEASDERRARGAGLGPLDGIPYAVKDLFDVEGYETPAGSRHRGLAATSDSAAVAALRAAGMVLIGRTTMDEYAYGMTSAPARNARNPDHSPGGSSGGSAAAVASGEVPVALGSDTGGSVLVPAALNGIVGFKPSHGLVGTAGTTALSPSLDHVGVLARTVPDIQLVMSALAGTACAVSSEGPMTIGVPTAFFTDRLHPEVFAAYRLALPRLSAAGHHLVPFEPPMSEHYGLVEDIVCITELAAAQGERVRAFADEFGPVIRHYVEVGYRIPFDTYRTARDVQAAIRSAWIAELGTADFVLTPAAPITAPLAAEGTFDWGDGTVDDVNELLGCLAVPGDLTGLPSIALPGGADSRGLPIGLQLIGGENGDATLLSQAARLAPTLNPH